MRFPLLALLLAFLLSTFAQAANDEIDKLLQQRKFDQALKSIRDSRAELGDAFGYYQGIALAGQAKSDSERAKAEQTLQEFLTKFPQHRSAPRARTTLAELHRRQAQSELAKKSPDRSAAANKLNKALAIVEHQRDDARDALKKLPVVVNDATRTKRDNLRREFLTATLRACLIREELADTAATKSARQELLIAAAQTYEEVHNKYRTRMAGLFAHLYRGRCLKKANHNKAAAAIFGEILEQPKTPPFETLQLEALKMLVEILHSAENHKEIIGRGVAWLAAKRDARSHPIRLALARAYLDQSPPDRDKARELLAMVRPAGGVLGGEAIKLLSELGDAPLSAESFAENTTLGLQSLAAVQKLDKQVADIEAKIKVATEEEATQLRKSLQATVTTRSSKQRSATGYLGTALKLAKTPKDKDKAVHLAHMLGYLHWRNDEFSAAHEISDRYLRRNPTHKKAPELAKLAMLCLVREWQAAEKIDRDVVLKEMDRLLEFAKQHLPKAPISKDILKWKVRLEAGM